MDIFFKEIIPIKWIEQKKKRKEIHFLFKLIFHRLKILFQNLSKDPLLNITQ